MKIGKKLFLMIITLNLIGILLSVGIILYLNQKRMTALVYREIKNSSSEHTHAIKAWLDNHLYATCAFGQVMERMDQIPPLERRSFFALMVKSGVESDSDVLGAAMVWEPNAIDGLDADYAGQVGADEQGRYVPYWSKTKAGVSMETLTGYDIPLDGDYYLIPKQTGNELLTGPVVYPIDGIDRLMVTVSAPINHAGRFAGVVTRDIAINHIQEQLETINPYPGTVAMVYSYNGLIAGHFDKSRLGKLIEQSETDIVGVHLPHLLESIQNNQVFRFTNYIAGLKKEMVFVSIPFSVGTGTKPWSLIVGIPTSVISAPLYQSLGISALICAVMVILVTIGAFFMARSISSPLAYAMTVLKDIAAGDLTQEIRVSSKDEVGDLARYLNFTVDHIKNLVLAIKREADTLSFTGRELATNMTETAASVNEITAVIKSVKSQATNQASSLKDTNMVMGKVVEHIEIINDQIKKQTECVDFSSSAVEEMLDNIKNVSQSLIKNGENITKLAQASQVGRTGLEEVAADIQEIARESEGLLEINAVMENIASQTSLLSMNAAIEAAHAGEIGKGFAVVADEIRKLAESSSEQSKTISAVLNKIKGSIDKITKSTNEVLQNFEAINEQVQTVTDQETSVRNAMEEQGVGSEYILESIGSLNEITGEVTRSASGIFDVSHGVMKESTMLEHITEEIRQGMQEMASGAEQINSAINRVNEISIENKRKIAVLMTEVSQFKVE
ncbi:MAG: methyl-accepting chemotaxis protein [Spirochaetaceae bacterium]|jgi:methyl-accepting chemotaxis protein|nr:methyl-accepting chemotaxis protein [Spirochaetaceae bacterium]